MTDSLPALALADEALEFDLVMKRPPRPRKATIIDKLMATSIGIHTFVLTASILGTYIWGLKHFTGHWNPNLVELDLNDEEAVDETQFQVRQAQTMVMFNIVFAELLRGYTSRSLMNSVWSLGIFTNCLMQVSVLSAIVLTFFVGLVPGVNTIFGMEALDGPAWLWILCFSLLSPILDELLKLYYRMSGFSNVEPNEHQKAVLLRQAAPLGGDPVSLVEFRNEPPSALQDNLVKSN